MLATESCSSYEWALGFGLRTLHTRGCDTVRVQAVCSGLPPSVHRPVTGRSPVVYPPLEARLEDPWLVMGCAERL